MSLALYYTGRGDEAVEAAEKALELSPEDERIKRNLELMRKNTVDNAGKV